MDTLAPTFINLDYLEIDTDGTVETRDNRSVLVFTRPGHPRASSKCRVFAIISGVWRVFDHFLEHLGRVIQD